MPKSVVKIDLNSDSFDSEFSINNPFDCQVELESTKPRQAKSGSELNESYQPSVSNLPVIYLGKVVFTPNKLEYKDEYEHTYIMAINLNGEIKLWSAKSDTFPSEDIRRLQSMESNATEIQVKEIPCFWKPTDKAYIVFRSALREEKAPSEIRGEAPWILEIVKVRQNGSLEIMSKLSDEITRLLQPRLFHPRSIDILKVPGWSPEQSFMFMWGYLEGEKLQLKIVDLQNKSLLSPRQDKTAAQKNTGYVSSFKPQEVCLFADDKQKKHADVIQQVVVFMIRTPFHHLPLPSHDLFEWKLSISKHSTDSYWIDEAKQVPFSQGAEKLFQVPERDKFFLWQKDAEKKDAERGHLGDVISLWSARFSSEKKERKERKISEFVNWKDFGPVSNVLFESFKVSHDESNFISNSSKSNPDRNLQGTLSTSVPQRNVMVIVLFSNTTSFLVLEYPSSSLSSSSETSAEPSFKVIDLVDKRETIALEDKTGFIKSARCIWVTIKLSSSTSSKQDQRYTLLIGTQEDSRHSKDESLQYRGVLVGADRCPACPLLDLGECGIVYGDVEGRIVHYKNVKQTSMINLRLFDLDFLS